MKRVIANFLFQEIIFYSLLNEYIIYGIYIGKFQQNKLEKSNIILKFTNELLIEFQALTSVFVLFYC